jgi:hypothetical protein
MDRTERQINLLLSQAGPIDIEVDVRSDFEHGLQVLEAVGESRAADLREVTLKGHTSDGDERHRVRQRRFARFVNLLERHGREGVRSLTLAEVSVDSESYRRQHGLGDGGTTDFSEDDQARLFGEVLPSLSRLERLRFFQCLRYETNLALFLSKSSSSSSPALVELSIDNCYGHCNFSDCVPAIAAMIQGNSVPIQVLKLYATTDVMNKDDCQKIFWSLRHNTTLRRLEVLVFEVYDDVLILPPPSTIRCLRIEIRNFTKKGKSILAKQLTTNAVLEELHIVHPNDRSHDHRPWIEMLESHNYALRVLSEGRRYDDREGPTYVTDERVVACLRRNERIRQALEQLQGTYHVSPVELGPRVWGMVSKFPTLLYAFVRRGDVNALADLLLAQQQRGGDHIKGNAPKKRRLPRTSPSH